MLYRFAHAGSAAQVSADVSRVRAALPPGSLLGAQSWLTAKLRATRSIAPWVPFIVAFGLIGLVMAVLIVASVISGAVAAGTRRIGVLKSVGFSPAQVVAAYVLQVAIPAAAGAVTGVLAGNLLSVPLLSQTARVYGVGALAVPPWVDVAVPLAMLGLTVAAALPPALRAGRLSAVQAIATGRAPRAARGYGAHHLLSALHGRARWLPRSLTLGLAAPFARPGRTLVMLVAVLLGGTAVTFTASLATSLDRVATDLSHARAEPVQVGLPGQDAVLQPAGAPSCPARPRSSAPSRPRSGRSRGRCATWPKPTTTSACPACRSSCRWSRSAATPAGPATSSSPGTGTAATTRPSSTPASSPTPARGSGQLPDHVREQARHGPDHR